MQEIFVQWNNGTVDDCLTNHKVGDDNEQYVWNEAKYEDVHKNFGYEEW